MKASSHWFCSGAVANNMQFIPFIFWLATANFGLGRLSDWIRINSIPGDKIEGLSEEDELLVWKIRLDKDEGTEFGCSKNEVATGDNTLLACSQSPITITNRSPARAVQKVHWSKIQIEEKSLSPTRNSTIYGMRMSSRTHIDTVIRNRDGIAPAMQSIAFRIFLERSNFSNAGVWTVKWEKLGSTEHPQKEMEWPSRMTQFVVEINEFTYGNNAGKYLATVTDEVGGSIWTRNFEFLTVSSVQTLPGEYFRWTKSITPENAVSDDFIDLMLASGPRIDPEKHFYRINESIVLMCSYTGNPFSFEHASIYWKPSDCEYRRNDDQFLNCSKQIRIPGVDDPNGLRFSLLQISGGRSAMALVMEAQESGAYSCAYNDSGQFRIDPPKDFVISESPDGQGVFVERIRPSLASAIYAGDTIVLRCVVNRFRFLNAVWRYKNLVLDSGSFDADAYNITLTETKYSFISLLTISNSTESDRNFYWCKATKRRREWPLIEDEAALNLTVLPTTKPYFGEKTAPIEAVTRAKGSQIELYCDAKGAPPPQITWFKNEKSITCDEGRCKKGKIEIRDDNRLLKIYSADSDDSAEYYCMARSRTGFDRHSFKIMVEDFGKSNAIALGVCLALALLMAITCAMIAVKYWRSYKRKAAAFKKLQELETELEEELTQEPPALDQERPTNDQVDLIQFDVSSEIPDDQLEVTRIILGSGAFGTVKLAYLKLDDDQRLTVAAKFANDELDYLQQKSLIREMKLMMRLGHHVNVVGLLGVVRKNLARGKLCAVLEYCKHGSLKDHMLRARNNMLRQSSSSSTGSDTDQLIRSPSRYVSIIKDQSSHKSAVPVSGSLPKSVYASATEVVDFVVTLWDILCYSYQIACGLEHLAINNIVHRDIALRNMLLTEAGVVKVSDFGLARRDKGTIEEDEKLPWRWMALEALRDSDFGKESDVWSFGVVLWELFSYGQEPHSDFGPSGFVTYLENGGHLPQLEDCPEQMYNLMLNCWHANKFERPSFVVCQQTISEFALTTCPEYWRRALDFLEKTAAYFVKRPRYFNRKLFAEESKAEPLIKQTEFERIQINAVGNPEYLRVIG